MHADELEIDEALVQGLLANQFPGVGRVAASPDRAQRHSQRDLSTR